MKRLVWLASYPRSGNTWFRALLTNFLGNGAEPARIDELIGDGAAERTAFDDWVGCDSGELTRAEIERLRPRVYLERSRQGAGLEFLKVHDACLRLPDGTALFPPEATHAAIYILRNPLDVCVSLARLSGHTDYDPTIRELADPAAASQDEFATEASQLPQTFLSWSGHVTSWVDAPGLRVLVLRYEDLKRDPAGTFGSAVRFLGYPDDAARVRRAVEFSAFAELRRQEEKGGFSERVPSAEKFFREGRAGGWREVLTAAQVAQVLADHGAVMRRFGYLDSGGTPPG